METNSLIIIIILGFFALWLVTRNGINNEKFPSGANTLDSTTRLGAGGIAGPIPWAPALINAHAWADGSPYRGSPWWIPTSPPWKSSHTSTKSVPRRLKEKATN